MAELSTIVEEGTSSENPLAGLIDPSAVMLEYKRMPNRGDEVLPRALREMPEDIRNTHPLDEGELVAVINYRVRVRKQFQMAFTKEGHLRQRFVAILDRTDDHRQPLFSQEVINSNCPKREIKKIASQNPLLFTASGRLRSRAPKKLTDKREQGKFTKYGATEVKTLTMSQKYDCKLSHATRCHASLRLRCQVSSPC
ncbi:hypothetical protein N7468_006556 [Penicillium chermesinum]|uniref:Uncharacterized protein n=1 Tax=Penicillium chermesinum TaxID=63820 RepID=A0A9W9NSF8_9EURO|nr:uncharacterized protein N7468_006556 [Penicillium chermesinum]KAJ5225331.1 hypothetical protein N7468_006556 [Penicillium chermesinum]